jgi:hypothetical protein
MNSRYRYRLQKLGLAVLPHVLHLLGPLALQQAVAHSSSCSSSAAAPAAAVGSSSSAAAASIADSTFAVDVFADLVRQLVESGETLHYVQ